MAKPVHLTNDEKVANCLQYLLGTVNHANGWRTNGLVVDISRDPRIVAQDKIQEFAELGAIVTVFLGGAGADGHIVGRRLGFQKEISLWCLRTLSDQELRDGVTILQAEAWLRSDIAHLFQDDCGLKETAAILHAANPTLGFDKISCTNLHVARFIAGDASHPTFAFVAACSYGCEEHSHLIHL